MDVGWDTNDNLRWKTRGETIEYCNGEPCGTAITSAICDDAGLCAAYNFNNVAFGMAGNFMTDGYNTTATYGATSLTVTLSSVQVDGVSVQIWSDDTTEAFLVQTNGSIACTSIASAVDSLYLYDCDNRTVSSVRVYRSLNNLQMREIQVFERIDTTRTYGVFENL
jgi:hypothetical protein